MHGLSMPCLVSQEIDSIVVSIFCYLRLLNMRLLRRHMGIIWVCRDFIVLSLCCLRNRLQKLMQSRGMVSIVRVVDNRIKLFTRLLVRSRTALTRQLLLMLNLLTRRDLVTSRLLP